jgi:hypothetical protein
LGRDALSDFKLARAMPVLPDWFPADAQHGLRLMNVPLSIFRQSGSGCHKKMLALKNLRVF